MEVAQIWFFIFLGGEKLFKLSWKKSDLGRIWVKEKKKKTNKKIEVAWT